MYSIHSKSCPLISIITVTRNSAKDLPDCLASVAAQGGVDYEHCIVDGASTDGTVELLRAQTNARLRWISEPDRGIYDAMNKAVRMARGQWIYFLGADDRLRSGALRTMTSYFRHPLTLYYGNVWMTKRQIRYAGRFGAIKLALKNICQQAVFYPSRVFESYAFDERYPIQADWVLNMACWKDRRFLFQYIPMIVADFRDEGGASSERRDLAIERDYTLLLHRYFPLWIAWPLTTAVHTWRFLKRKQIK